MACVRVYIFTNEFQIYSPPNFRRMGGLGEGKAGGEHGGEGDDVNEKLDTTGLGVFPWFSNRLDFRINGGQAEEEREKGKRNDLEVEESDVGELRDTSGHGFFPIWFPSLVGFSVQGGWAEEEGARRERYGRHFPSWVFFNTQLHCPS